MTKKRLYGLCVFLFCITLSLLVYQQPTFAQTCGNGILEAPEECDDGNLIDGDWCSSSCLYSRTIDLRQPFGGALPSFTRYGTKVDLSGDRVIIGNGDLYSNNSYAEAAWISRYNGTSWLAEQKISAADGVDGDQFGSSVGISGDYAIVGAYYDDINGYASGSAYIFHYNGASWVQEQILTPSDPGTSQYFGISVVISGDNAFIGRNGAVYVFHFNGASWVQEQKLTPAGVGGTFGFSAAVSGDYLIIGAYGDNDLGTGAGAAYIFHYNGASWEQQQKLTATDGAASDHFGCSVDISGNYAIIGATGNDDQANEAGAAYIFRFNGFSWVEEQKFTASGGSSYAWLGWSVAVSDDGYALIGAPWETGANVASGAVYMYQYSNVSSSWTFFEKLLGNSTSDEFGDSVAISSNYALIGAPGRGSYGVVSFINTCSDRDNDGVCANTDNCPMVANPSQTDGNGDGLGDACSGSSFIHSPHNNTYGITCANCHSNALPPTNRSAVCEGCHDGTVPVNGVMLTHSDFVISGGVSNNWSFDCLDCHDPHFHFQLANMPGVYLATGTINPGSIVNNDNGTSTLTYSSATIDPGWNPPPHADNADWGAKTGPGRGLALVDNSGNPNKIFDILSATDTQITVNGLMSTAMEGNTFGVVYGQNIRLQINDKSVFFTDHKSFANNDGLAGDLDGDTKPDDSTPDGICQVCHTATLYWKANGAVGDHYAQPTDLACNVCHQTALGFKDEFAGIVALTSATYSVGENGVTATITATRTGGMKGAISVNYATSDGTAAAGPDYLAANGSLSWADGDTTDKTFEITIIDDAVAESDETVNIALTNATGGSLLGTLSTATLTITDVEIPVLYLSSANYFALESDGTAVVSLKRTGGSSGAVSVDYTTSDGTALGGSDYSANSGTISWADGDIADKTFDIPILEDALYEGGETVNIAISNATGGAILGSPDTAVLTILDNDSGIITLSSADYTVAENAGIVTITITRTSSSSGAVSVEYATADDTANAADYTAASGTLFWADGDAADKTFDIQINNDALPEGDETLNIAIANPTGGAILGTPNTAVLTITDDDIPPQGMIVLSSPTYTVAEDVAWATITVMRTYGSGGAVTVDYGTSEGTAQAFLDYYNASGTLSWADGDTLNKTFDIQIKEDLLLESDETLNIAITNPTGGVATGDPNTAVLTITDNEIDSPGTLSLVYIPDPYMSESNAPRTIKVRRSGGFVGSVSVDYASSDITATAGVDYTVPPGTLTWGNGDGYNKTFLVTVINDTIYEGSETFNLFITNPTGGATIGTPNSAEFRIDDDDPAPSTMALSASSYSVSEGGVSATITATRIGTATGVVTVDYATSDGTASAGTDYTAAFGTLSWVDGDLADKTFDINILDDALFEGDETVIIILSNITGQAALGIPNTAVLTIVENDSSP